VNTVGNTEQLPIEGIEPQAPGRPASSPINKLHEICGCHSQTMICHRGTITIAVFCDVTKYMLLSRHQNAGQNHDIERANRCFENVAQFRYLGTNVTNQNLIKEEINRRLNSGNDCYHSVQNLLSSRLLSKIIKIRIYKIIILSVDGYETWSLTLREEHRQGACRVLRRIFGPKRDEVKGVRRKMHNEELHNLYSSPNIIRMIK
jgi:hypothetical protein